MPLDMAVGPSTYWTKPSVGSGSVKKSNSWKKLSGLYSVSRTYEAWTPAVESRAPMLAAKSVVKRMIANGEFGFCERRRTRERESCFVRKSFRLCTQRVKGGCRERGEMRFFVQKTMWM